MCVPSPMGTGTGWRFQGPHRPVGYLKGWVGALWLQRCITPLRDDGTTSPTNRIPPATRSVRFPAVFCASAQAGTRSSPNVAQPTPDQQPWFQRAEASPFATWILSLERRPVKFSMTHLLQGISSSPTGLGPCGQGLLLARFYSNQRDLLDNRRCAGPAEGGGLSGGSGWDGLVPRRRALPLRAPGTNAKISRYHAFLKVAAAHVLRRFRPDASGRGIQWPETHSAYFARATNATCLHFRSCPASSCPLGQDRIKHRHPRTDPVHPDACHFAFLRNHDEILPGDGQRGDRDS